MSDASVCSDCSDCSEEVFVLDPSAVSVVCESDAADHDRDRDAPQSNENDNDGRDHEGVSPAPANDVANNNNNHRKTRDNNNQSGGGDDDELPSLANLVAATVRDRVVLEQMEEIRALRAQLRSSNRVEVTGPNGHPVYARGDFSRGEFNSISAQIVEGDEGAQDQTGLFWDVGLETAGRGGGEEGGGDDADGRGGTAPLHGLSNVEIRIGGVLYVTTAEVEGTSMAFGIRPGNRFDGDMSRSAVAEFNTEDGDPASATGGRSALLTFHVRDFPKGHWRSLQSVAMLNRSIALRQREREEAREERRELRRVDRTERIERGEVDPEEAEDDSDYESDYDDEEDQDPLDVYNYLTLCLSKRHPKQKADITSVSLCVKSVRGRIDSLHRGEEFNAKKEKFFRKIDEMYREELDGRESLREALETAEDD